MYKLILISLISILSIDTISQTISGRVLDENKKPLPGTNIFVKSLEIGSTTDNNGEYFIELETNKSIVIEFSFIGYSKKNIRIPMLKKSQNYTLNIEMNPEGKLINDIIIEDKKIRKQSITNIKTQHVNIIPSSNGSVETILKTLPGVSSANELSSQYSVRGGNFDENMVYINGIEVYRPLLINSGQQEGLSIVNSKMVEKILFSSGGYESKYGDKMSSVLDIKYRIPNKNKASIDISILGGSSHFEGIALNNKFSYLFSSRYKTNRYLLNSMDVRAEYTPSFSDIQTYLNYKKNENWSFSFLGNISQNKFRMIPSDRETEFGTLNEALKLRIYFEGQESNVYNTYFGAINTCFNPNLNTEWNFTTSTFKTIESQNYDILGEYWLYELDNNLGSDNFGDVQFDRGVGKYINHARNRLNISVINTTINGHYISKNDDKLEWGAKYQIELINDKINEWTLIDSAGFTLPHPLDNIGGISDTNQEILMSESLRTNLNITTNRISSYIQWNKDIGNFSINGGTRFSSWSYNNEKLISPRINIAYLPNWKKDIIFRFSSGVYYQSPFYKELRNQNGILNTNIKSQRSIHYVIGSDYLFYSWGRPFKFTSELYYKDLDNLIPYKIDNVNIQYLSDNISKGYATGIDLRVNGEFVSGLESWASISIMQTKEDILGDSYIDEETDRLIYPGFIPRPTDQRVNFSIFFQDYLPKNPNYKMHLNLIYGTGLPFGAPNAEKFQDILRMPSYRRVDIGFSAIIKSEDNTSKINILNKLKHVWISMEVFNLLNIDNTISYLWVSDINGRQYAVPNYLTSRQLNIKLSIGI